ncbi:MAG: helix-turn-helix domain-containing protein, partial [Gemmatimonadota bacterium]
VISLESLPPNVTKIGKHGVSTAPVSAEIIGEEGVFLDAEMDRLEKALLLKALDKTGGNRTEASKLLNISFRSMRYRLEKHGIE